MENNKVWIISDHHFHHKNILKYEDRPFNTIEEMNEKMIENWNSVINDSNKVFHLGDFCFSNKEDTKSIIDKLNGYIILIKGNHDRKHSTKWLLETGFDEVYSYPIIYCQDYILSHEPIDFRLLKGFKNIHGHIHSPKRELEYPDVNKDSYINVCVEVNNYTPILFEKILKTQ